MHDDLSNDNNVQRSQLKYAVAILKEITEANDENPVENITLGLVLNALEKQEELLEVLL